MTKSNDKLIFKVYKTETACSSGVIRVGEEAVARLQEVQRATGWPISKIASKMIQYAYDHVDIVEE